MRFQSVIDIPDRSSGHGPPEVPALLHYGCGTWTRRKPFPYPNQRHPCWELHYLAEGSLRWRLEGREHLIQAGDCFLAGPHEEHDGFERILHRIAACWVNFDPIHLRGKEGRLLEQRMRKLPVRCFPGGAGVPAALGLLFFRLQQADRAAILLHSALHSLLAALLAAASEQRGTAPRDALLDRMKDLMRARLAQPLAIPALAAELGLGVSRLRQRCVARLGQSPLEVLTELRITRAQELLRRGCAVASTALSCGFGSPQHFSRVFQRQTGLLPSRWVQQESQPISGSASRRQ